MSDIDVEEEYLSETSNCWEEEEENVDDDALDLSDQEECEILPYVATVELPALTERITSPFMSKYERARIIGVRALQISQNAPVFIEVQGSMSDPIEIARAELMQKKTPFIIRRHLPDGSHEDWNITEMNF